MECQTSLITRRPFVFKPTRSFVYRRSFGRSTTIMASANDGKEGVFMIATNNFKVKPGSEEAFEEMWKTRQSQLKEHAGFVRFALLRCDTEGEYVSQTQWESRKHFEDWRQSQSFQNAHSSVKESKNGRPPTMEMLEGRPQPKFYEAVTVTESS